MEKSNSVFLPLLRSNFAKDWIYPILTAVVAVIIINRFLFFNVNIPTPSMEPTVKVKSRLFVTRIYNYDNLERGDIIVFKNRERDNRLLKRLIGMPGDTIYLKNNGDVLVNGKLLEEPYVKNQIKEDGDYLGMKLGEYKVPEGCYFFLGDNRSNSRDARYWNNPYIPQKDLQGEARFIFFPFSRFNSELYN